jgi:hypothetical protein
MHKALLILSSVICYEDKNVIIVIVYTRRNSNSLGILKERDGQWFRRLILNWHSHGKENKCDREIYGLKEEMKE